ncbi:Uncharacterized protein PBTT_09189 [Plasmodiophora brassicae]
MVKTVVVLHVLNGVTCVLVVLMAIGLWMAASDQATNGSKAEGLRMMWDAVARHEPGTDAGRFEQLTHHGRVKFVTDAYRDLRRMQILLCMASFAFLGFVASVLVNYSKVKSVRTMTLTCLVSMILAYACLAMTTTPSVVSNRVAAEDAFKKEAALWIKAAHGEGNLLGDVLELLREPAEPPTRTDIKAARGDLLASSQIVYWVSVVLFFLLILTALAYPICAYDFATGEHKGAAPHGTPAPVF